MLNHSQPDPLPAAPVDPPHDADAVERGHITPPATPTNLANNVMDHNHTPARPGINATQLGPKPPQDKNLRPLYTGVEKMEHNLHEVSLDEMFKTYLDCGGEPTAEDLAAFTYYDEDKLKTVARESGLGPMICMMGKSVADRQGGRETIRFCDISDSRPRTSAGSKYCNSRKRKPTDGEEDSEALQEGTKGKSQSYGTTPDIGIYLNNERTGTVLMRTPKERQKRARKAKKETKKETETEKEKESNEAHQAWLAHRSWSDLVAFFEAKIEHAACAFEFTNPTTRFVRDDTDGGEKSLGQFLEYLAQILAHQHRTHLFAVYIYKNQARLVFADRSGAVVSEPFLYGSPDHPKLHIFFWKLACMSNKERGFDESATLAADADVRAMREYADKEDSPYLQAQAYYALSWDPEATEGKKLKSFEWPMHQLSVKNRTVFVGRPSFATHSLFGRCTRGYVAFEKVEEGGKTSWCLRYLKDCWRVKDADKRILAEHEVYDRLRKSGAAERVPTCLAFEDVVCANGSHQETRLHKIGGRTQHPRRHYRMLMADVYRPLSDFSDFRELAKLLRDALQAHKDAWEKAGVLHRDVSFNNILIHEFEEGSKTVRRGILSDWDLSKYKEHMSDAGPRQPDRTGTWYFRSAVLGRYPRKPYEVSDDIESFIHVYHYSILRFHRTNMTDSLKADVSVIYEQAVVRPEDGAHMGSNHKFNYMRSAEPFITVEGNASLQAVLDVLADLHSQHYATIDKAEYDRMYAIVDQLQPANSSAEAEQQDASGNNQDGGKFSQRLRAALKTRKAPSAPPANKTLNNHRELLDLFSQIGSSDWDKCDLSKSAIDLFKIAGLAPRGNNGFSSSQGLSSQDATHMQKKRKANTGSWLPSVGESQEPAGLEG